MVIIVPNIISAANEFQANPLTLTSDIRGWFSVRGEIFVPIIFILTLMLLMLIVIVLLVHRENRKLMMWIRVDTFV